MEQEDQLALVRASVDQLTMLLAEITPLIGAYYKRLTQVGVPDNVAAALMKDFHKAILDRVGL